MSVGTKIIGIDTRIIAPITGDVVKYWCWEAAMQYSGERIFSNAVFSNVVRNAMRLESNIDGNIIRVILAGRDYLEQIDECYYKYIGKNF